MTEIATTKGPKNVGLLSVGAYRPARVEVVEGRPILEVAVVLPDLGLRVRQDRARCLRMRGHTLRPEILPPIPQNPPSE